MTNYLYCDKIGERIKEILDREVSPECAKNISTGDFRILPEPEKMDIYLPALLINNVSVDIEDVNSAMDIVRMEHLFEIYYLYPYTYAELEDIPAKAKENLRSIANVLMNFRGLDGFSLSQQEEEIGGFVEETSVYRLNFHTTETKLFRDAHMPVAVGKIDYKVVFRTYQRR